MSASQNSHHLLMSGLALSGMALAIGLSEDAWPLSCVVVAALLVVLPALKPVREATSGFSRVVLDVLDQVLWFVGATVLVVLVEPVEGALLVAALFVAASLTELAASLRTRSRASA